MNVFIVEQGANPSSDFFVWPYIKAQSVSIIRATLADTLPSLTAPVTKVVFVRYLTPAWRKWVEHNREHIGQVVLFMDDDLFDCSAHAGLPLRYRFKLWNLAFRHQAWLRAIGAELWVSTPWLAEKYASWQPKLLIPQSPYSAANSCFSASSNSGPHSGSNSGPHSGISAQKTLFYHGSASHQAEFDWLYPVFEQVLAQDASLSVELIGNHKIRKQFAALPRVHVLHPMSWPAYQALLNRPGRTIGLAPLLENRFNAARAPTKFFDISQAGAVGIYADHPVYSVMIRHGENGLLLPMVQQAWVDEILRLSEDEPARVSMLKNAQFMV